MATQRPTLKELIERIEQDFVSRLETGTPARISLLRTMGRGQAGLAHGLYGYIDTKEKNFLPDTGDEASVLRWANLFGITQLSPVAAKGSVQATGTNGVLIPAGRELQSSDGIVYTVDVDATIASGIAAFAVTAKDRGIAGNLDTGTALNFIQPIAGILSAVTVLTPGLTGGSETETIEALRVRVLDRMQSPPKGGASSDYVEWAKAAHPSVTRAWVSGQEMSANSVTVRLVTDDDPVSLIPSSEVLDAVADYIAARRPVTAEVYVVAPTAAPLAMSIAIDPTTQAVKDAITAELADLIKREAEPGGTILLSRINEAISNSAGESDHNLITPTANVTHTAGQIATLGTITWSDL
jgi:uncharacterized phage protein gp47/JayE